MIQSLNKHGRDTAYRQVRDLVNSALGAWGTGHGGMCLYYAMIGREVVRKLPGVPRVVVQAGTAYWPRVDPSEDDGVMPLQFGYEWQPHQALEPLPNGQIRLPEMHVWLGCPDTQEVIDFSTAHLPDECLRATGYEWRTHRYDYLWCLMKRLPAGVIYRPEREATILAEEIIRRHQA